MFKRPPHTRLATFQVWQPHVAGSYCSGQHGSLIPVTSSSQQSWGMASPGDHHKAPPGRLKPSTVPVPHAGQALPTSVRVACIPPQPYCVLFIKIMSSPLLKACLLHMSGAGRAQASVVQLVGHCPLLQKVEIPGQQYMPRL